MLSGVEQSRRGITTETEGRLPVCIIHRNHFTMYLVTLLDRNNFMQVSYTDCAQCFEFGMWQL